MTVRVLARVLGQPEDRRFLLAQCGDLSTHHRRMTTWCIKEGVGFWLEYGDASSAGKLQLDPSRRGRGC